MNLVIFVANHNMKNGTNAQNHSIGGVDCRAAPTQVRVCICFFRMGISFVVDAIRVGAARRSAPPTNPTKFYPVFKQGLFAFQTSLVYNAKKACLRCKQAFFEMLLKSLCAQNLQSLERECVIILRPKRGKPTPTNG
jgi:hypothetical protein